MDEILNIANKSNKEVVAYLSMGFGNPYGDPWNVDIVRNWIEKLSKMGVKTLRISDEMFFLNNEHNDQEYRLFDFRG